MTKILPIFLAIFTICGAAPIEDQIVSAAGNTTLLSTITVRDWSPGSLYRGTADILLPCLVTIFASIYTAIHLNIPEPHSGKWRRRVQKLCWSLFTLLVPELVLLIAALQNTSARLLRHALWKIVRPKEESTWSKIKGVFKIFRHKPKARSRIHMMEHGYSLPTQSPTGLPKSAQVSSSELEPIERHDYSMTYAFWVEMGGFRVDTSDISNEYSSVAITTKGLNKLAKLGYLHRFQLSDDEIEDRSKSDSLGKFLVCLQVFWTFIQIALRWYHGYPISLLELNTLVSAFFAITIYASWWHKPLDVECPITVDATEFIDVIALMLMASTPAPNGSRKDKKELEQVNFFSDRTSEPQPKSFLAEIPHTHQLLRNNLAMNRRVNTRFSPRIDDVATSSAGMLISSSQHLNCGLGPLEQDMCLTPADEKRWCLATSAMAKIRRQFGGELSLDSQEFKDMVWTGSNDCITTNCDLQTPYEWIWSFHDKPFDISPYGDKAQRAPLVMIISFLLAFLHLAARTNPAVFPTAWEQSLWITAAYISGGLGFVVCFIDGLGPWIYGKIAGHFCKRNSPTRVKVGNAIRTVWVLLFAATYLVCRLWFIFEAFFSLFREVPLGCLASTPWIDIWHQVEQHFQH